MKRLLLILLCVALSQAQLFWNQQQNQQQHQQRQQQQQQQNNQRHGGYNWETRRGGGHVVWSQQQQGSFMPGTQSNNTTPTNRAFLSVSFVSYTNYQRRLPGNAYCYWVGHKSPNRQDCRFQFTTIVQSTYGNVNISYVNTTGLLTLDPRIGQINFQGNPWNNYFPYKPTSIAVIVIHNGNIANATGLQDDGQVVYVDSFVLNLANVVPATTNTPVTQGGNAVTLIGLGPLQTQLSIQYTVRCTNNMLGPNCDLSCNQTTQSTSGKNRVPCFSTLTGYNFSCQSTSPNGVAPANQMYNCTQCPYGLGFVQATGYCSSPGPVNPVVYTSSGGGYYAATIVLGIICAILFIFLMGAIFFWWWSRSKEEERDNMRARAQWSGGAVSKPLIRPTPPEPSDSGYRSAPVPDPEWQPTQTAAMQRSGDTDSPRPGRPYYDAAPENASQRTSQASANGNYSVPRREAAV